MSNVSDEKVPMDDVEVNGMEKHSSPIHHDGGVGTTGHATALEEHAIVGRFGRAQGIFAKMFAAGVEARGIERVPETERTDRNSANSLFLWFSVNTVLTTRACLFLLPRPENHLAVDV